MAMDSERSIFHPDTWIKTCAGLALVIIALSVAYYFVIYLPRERTVRLEMERQERLAREERERERMETERQEKQDIEVRERERLEIQRRESESRQAERLTRDARRTQMDRRLTSCISAEFDAYEKKWRETCWRLGDSNNNCLLPKFNADELGKGLKDAEGRCLRFYPR